MLLCRKNGTTHETFRIARRQRKYLLARRRFVPRQNSRVTAWLVTRSLTVADSRRPTENVQGCRYEITWMIFKRDIGCCCCCCCRRAKNRSVNNGYTTFVARPGRTRTSVAGQRRARIADRGRRFPSTPRWIEYDAVSFVVLFFLSIIIVFVVTSSN